MGQTKNKFNSFFSLFKFEMKNKKKKIEIKMNCIRFKNLNLMEKTHLDSIRIRSLLD